MDNDAKRKMESKFYEYDGKTTDELLAILNELEKESDILEESFKKATSQAKTDIWNDIKYNNEKIDYVNKLLRDRYEIEASSGIKR